MVSTILIVIGVLFNLIGCIGLIRFPDVYNRLQSATKCGTLGNEICNQSPHCNEF